MNFKSLAVAALLALAVPLAAVGCATESAEQAQLGKLEMALTSTAASGNVYRLTGAVFDISGASSAQIASDDFPDQSSAVIDLPEGSYVSTLAEGWSLQRLEGASFVPVVAALRGQPDRDFEVVAGASTPVVYVFRTAGEDVVFGQGELDLSVQVEEVPGQWTCNLTYFDTADGCDCECGFPDPDCNIPGAQVWGCAPGQTCSAGGVCEGEGYVCGNGVAEPGEACDDGNVTSGDGCSASCDNENVPAEWTCDSAYYNMADGCDCNCGAYDPDCDIPDAQVYGCPTGNTCSLAGECVSSAVCGNGTLEAGESCDDGNNVSGDGCSATCVNENVPAGWTCDPSYYDVLDGCDCACGVPDPDCALPDQQVWGCAEGESCSAAGECVAP